MEEEEDGVANNNISVLPEGCISTILSLTSPWDVCRASAISWGFKAAADHDAVWEKFLPSDYPEIIARSVSPVTYATKKQLYFLLSDSHILLDDGKLSFKLNKWRGQKCYMVHARELSIAWKDTPYHWRWICIRIPESRFSEVAELLSVCWLEIRGKMATRMLSHKTTYAAYLVYKIKEECYGLDYAVESFVQFIGERADWAENETSAVYLTSPRIRRVRRTQIFGYMDRQVPQENARLPQKRTDGWMEIELGEFYNDQGDGEVEMALIESKVLNWKGGLIVEGIELRPKESIN